MTDFKLLYVHGLAWLMPFICSFLLLLAAVIAVTTTFGVFPLLTLFKQVLTYSIIFLLPLQLPFPCPFSSSYPSTEPTKQQRNAALGLFLTSPSER